MPRQGELTYFQVIGEAGRHFAVNKPFSQEECGIEMMQVGALLAKLPPPPGRILECGCGTGWLAHFLQKRGYQVVGTDVCIQAIELARAHPVFCGLNPPEFVVADSEQLPFVAEFDVVIFYDSLHHAVDERLALEGAYRALKPGGMCITSEPGRGHEARSQDVIAQFDVTEKDMPPHYVRKLGKAVGFRRSRVYPRADHVGRLLFQERWSSLGWCSVLLKIYPLKVVLLLLLLLFGKRYFGMTILYKDGGIR